MQCPDFVTSNLANTNNDITSVQIKRQSHPHGASIQMQKRKTGFPDPDYVFYILSVPDFMTPTKASIIGFNHFGQLVIQLRAASCNLQASSFRSELGTRMQLLEASRPEGLHE